MTSRDCQAKYGWSEQEMSSYLFVYRLGYMFSLWIIVPLMTNWIKLSDNTIAIIACLLSATGLTFTTSKYFGFEFNCVQVSSWQQLPAMRSGET